MRSRSSPAPHPGWGYAAARALAEQGWREIIVTGRTPGPRAGNGGPACFGDQKAGLHAAGAGSGYAVQRAVRGRLARRARPADRFPAAQCRDGSIQKARPHRRGRRGIAGPADRPSPTDDRPAPRQPAEPRSADRLSPARNLPVGGVPFFQHHRRRSLRRHPLPGQARRRGGSSDPRRPERKNTCPTMRMPTPSSSSPGGLPHWPAVCPPAWPYTPSRPVRSDRHQGGAQRWPGLEVSVYSRSSTSFLE